MGVVGGGGGGGVDRWVWGGGFVSCLAIQWGWFCMEGGFGGGLPFVVVGYIGKPTVEPVPNQGRGVKITRSPHEPGKKKIS